MKYRAKWILPIDKNPIENGSIEIKSGKIKKISRDKAADAIDLGDGVILPALINAHTHLEMPKIKTVSKKGFLPWLKSFLISIKTMDKKSFQNNLRKNEDKLAKKGVSAVCDITNHNDLNYTIAGFSFFEQIGWDLTMQEIGDNSTAIRSYAAHAIYSTSPEKIKLTYNYSKMHNLPWSIHLAESDDEIDFCNGKGRFIDFLKDLIDLQQLTVPYLLPAIYLDRLGVLGKNSILVHAIHLSDKELSLIKKRASTICVCPRSNAYIGVGKPNIKKFLKMGINIVSGTDSLLSNNDLDMIKETEYIVDNFGIAPETAIKFCTLNAQKILHIPYGILKEGYNTPLLFAQGNSQDPYEIIFDGKTKLIYE